MLYKYVELKHMELIDKERSHHVDTHSTKSHTAASRNQYIAKTNFRTRPYTSQESTTSNEAWDVVSTHKSKIASNP